MATKVEFSTLRYEQVHGHKPRGYALWYFALPGDVTLSYPGTYPAALRAISRRLKRYGCPAEIRIQVYA